MILWLFVACGSKQPAPVPAVPAPDQARSEAPVTTEKQSTPARVDRVDTAEGSSLQVHFDAPGDSVVVEAWGAAGLVLPDDRIRVEVGKVVVGQELAIEVSHQGAGDLAVQIAGTWSGVKGGDVRSFTIGDRKPTEVPARVVDGKKVKGWEATPR